MNKIWLDSLKQNPKRNEKVNGRIQLNSFLVRITIGMNYAIERLPKHT